MSALVSCAVSAIPNILYTRKGEVTMKKDDDCCKCDRPKVRIMYDDLGRAVKYCDKCWTTIADPKEKEK